MEKTNSINENIDIIQYPIITDKTTKNIENNVYSFKVKKQSKKNDIKEAIEYIFDVKVKKINTLNYPIKTKSVGKFKGNKTQYKKAIITLKEKYQINLFEDN
uniref:Large ribosomal subunit protein uL23c n=1 Tax=Alsidium seaforthii TaxID=2007182 RepID=A0A1Z1MDN4_9FLOR|nr:ribosomal protein L23 [Bryothamnion seaforthii]ARW63982.1 ribosomal protein L23 [Bryothamnion seaforthii]